MEREKGRERITTSCEYERESCPKVVKKWLSKYHFSFLRAMIFEQSFDTTFITTFFFSFLIGQKKWREKKDERE